jgi:hypothetical protein
VVFQSLGSGGVAYAAIFVASSVCRAFASLLLTRVPGTHIPRVGVVLRTLAVRPGWGMISRPIIATIGERRRDRRAGRPPGGEGDAAREPADRCAR